jgi:hypothetical protein
MYNMDLFKIIRKRKSCRTYNQTALKVADKRDLERFILENRIGLENEVVNFRIIEKESADNQAILGLGNFKGHNNYILGIVKSTVASRVNYGYLMEKIVLKATELNISTCWVGHFRYGYFNEVSIEDGFDIPSIVVVGYSAEKKITLKKFVKLILIPKRYSWDKLFFSYLLKTPLNPAHIKKYSDSLEMVRLAPSSGNMQPWRVFYNDTTNEFHFYKKSIIKRYELRGLHDIDMGVALSHFELATLQNGLSGSWFKHTNENISLIDDLQYIITWRCE